MANFDFQHLILKYFSKKHTLIKKIRVDFFTKSTIFIIGTFHISHALKNYFVQLNKYETAPKFIQ